MKLYDKQTVVDTIRTVYTSDMHALVDYVRAIDAAPAVSCEECKYGGPLDLSRSCDYCECGSEFVRRQPRIDLGPSPYDLSQRRQP